MDTVISVMAAVGLTVLAVVTALDIIWSWSTSDLADLPHLSPCQLGQLRFDPPLGIRPSSLDSPQWFMAMVLVGMFILRRYVLTAVTSRVYSHISEGKQIKVANYMFEFIGTTLALCITSAFDCRQVLFSPSDFDPPSLVQVHRLAFATNVLLATFVSMCTLEFAFDPNMRFGLAFYHWVSIVLTLWSVPVVYQLGDEAYALRAFFALSLHMSTEQIVFIEMMCYHLQMYSWSVLYIASAWLHALSRPVVMIFSMWTWWGMSGSIFDGLHHKPVVYALFLFIPAANLILNATQASTVVSLFGIAASVRKSARVERNTQDGKTSVTDAGAGHPLPTVQEEHVAEACHIAVEV